MKRRPLYDRFMEKFRVDPITGCWVWTAVRDQCGYGCIAAPRRCGGKPSPKMERASRVAWRLFRGDIPFGVRVLHTCDNPPCVNPNHLWLGSPRDNVLDMVQKGRHGRYTKPAGTPRGVAHWRTVLTETAVRAIRVEYTGVRGQRCRLAAKYGISDSTVYDIVRRRTWEHIV